MPFGFLTALKKDQQLKDICEKFWEICLKGKATAEVKEAQAIIKSTMLLHRLKITVTGREQ